MRPGGEMWWRPASRWALTTHDESGAASVRLWPATAPPRGLEVGYDSPLAHERRQHRRWECERIRPRRVPRHRADDRRNRALARKRRCYPSWRQMPPAIAGARSGESQPIHPRRSDVPDRLSHHPVHYAL
jgi:hypothetical protein